MLTICILCGYIYDGEQAYKSLPKDWCCPECGASLSNFDEIDESLKEKN